jgi:diaminopimelate epimerase
VKIQFTKMHGLGNDFILIDCVNKDFRIQNADFGMLARQLCNRRLGIGADQVLLLERSSVANFKMRIFNADGSEVEMCGNGTRCLAKYIWDRNLSEKDVLDIETLAGIIKPEKAGDMIKVDMGEPVFEPKKIPMNIISNFEFRISKGKKSKYKSQTSKIIIDYPLKIKNREFKITCVSMGNPHAVIVVDDLNDFPVTYYGPIIEKLSLFPKKTNVEFIEVINRTEMKMRVWERGSGETMACGTGASAAAVALNVKGLTEKKVIIHLEGGDLAIEWAGNNHVYITGPAVEVFTGVTEY